MPKVISYRTEIFKFYINLAHHEIIFECKLVLEELSFHMLSA